jgi:hypothetical protein
VVLVTRVLPVETARQRVPHPDGRDTKPATSPADRPTAHSGLCHRHRTPRKRNSPAGRSLTFATTRPPAHRHAVPCEDRTPGADFRKVQVPRDPAAILSAPKSCLGPRTSVGGGIDLPPVVGDATDIVHLSLASTTDRRWGRCRRWVPSEVPMPTTPRASCCYLSRSGNVASGGPARTSGAWTVVMLPSVQTMTIRDGPTGDGPTRHGAPWADPPSAAAARDERT